MITHIKSVNKDYNIFTIFLYLSEKLNRNRYSNKKEESNIKIKNILCEDINKCCIENDEFISENENYENIILKEINCNKQIINNIFKDISINNKFINNTIYFNGNNNFISLFKFYQAMILILIL